MKVGFSPIIPAVDQVPRTAVVEKMKKLSRKNIFVSAPGGYGKTVAVSQWLSSARGKSLIITATDEDNDPGVFYARLAAALRRLAGKDSSEPDKAISFDRLYKSVENLPLKKPRVYFVIDDLHMIKNEELISSIAVISPRLPAYICLCMISRLEPPEGFLETGLFETVSRDDLVFSAEEVEWLGAEKGIDLNADQISGLLKTTGGWAIYIAALLSGSKKAGDIRHEKTPVPLSQYLNNRIWKMWDNETKTLLLQLAVPLHVTPVLCELLTGCRNGRLALDRLSKKDNAFLSPAGDGIYRFHDIFREFLLERAEGFLGKTELRRLNDATARWHFDRGEYYLGAGHYISNGDHEGINRCMEATNRYHESSGSMSTEVFLSFTKQYVAKLPDEFIEENPYLICKRLIMDCYDGNVRMFSLYTDMIYKMMPEIARKYPNLLEGVMFIGALDFRVPLREYIMKVSKILPQANNTPAAGEPNTQTITQNLPIFHRSMRDFSEYHELRHDELGLLRNTFGVIIGRDYQVMEQLIIAGICYEKGLLLRAASHALSGYLAIDGDMQSETVFSAHMMLSEVLYALGASGESDRIMGSMGEYIEQKAQYLQANYNAMHTRRLIRGGCADAARQWLSINASRASRLPFYQICRHFTTLRSYIALGDHKAAIDFGERLQTLAYEYNRPLDQIESGLLTAIALWRNGNAKKAVRKLSDVISIAAPYGFSQLFINEGEEALPVLWELRKAALAECNAQFVEKIIQSVYVKCNMPPADESNAKLTAQQSAILPYLSKGLTYNEIGDALGIGRDTVKTHIRHLYRRLGVHNAQEAVLKAKMLGLLLRKE